MDDSVAYRKRRVGVKRSKAEEATLTLRVARTASAKAANPYWVTYTVAYSGGTLLAALKEIQRTIDGTLAFEYQCQKGLCGGCGVMVNGRPVLSCQARLPARSAPIRVEPLRAFAVRKDLIIDASPIWTRLSALAKESAKQPLARPTLTNRGLCIACGLCHAACPRLQGAPSFAGPMLLYGLTGPPKHATLSSTARAQLDHPNGLWHCTFAQSCGDVCPQRLPIDQVLQEYKLRFSLFFPLGHLWKLCRTWLRSRKR